MEGFLKTILQLIRSHESIHLTSSTKCLQFREFDHITLYAAILIGQIATKPKIVGDYWTMNWFIWASETAEYV